MEPVSKVIFSVPGGGVSIGHRATVTRTPSQVVKLEPVVSGVQGGGTSSAVLLVGGTAPEGSVLVPPTGITTGDDSDR